MNRLPNFAEPERPVPPGGHGLLSLLVSLAVLASVAAVAWGWLG